MKKIQAQDRLSGEKFKFWYTSKQSSLVKLGAVWLNVKNYQTDCPVKNKNFRIDWPDPIPRLWRLFGRIGAGYPAPIRPNNRQRRGIGSGISDYVGPWKGGGGGRSTPERPGYSLLLPDDGHHQVDCYAILGCACKRLKTDKNEMSNEFCHRGFEGLEWRRGHKSIHGGRAFQPGWCVGKMNAFDIVSPGWW